MVVIAIELSGILGVTVVAGVKSYYACMWLRYIKLCSCHFLLVIISLSFPFHFIQIKDAGDALVMKSPRDRLSEKGCDAELSYFIGERTIQAHRV